jgi:acyl-coenzyme A synthetase/AMP-(fatty) acid ligase
VSLTTPATIRNLQRKLNVKAKEEPSFRFYVSTTRSIGPEGSSWLAK